MSRVFEVGDNYVVAVMTEHIPAGTAPLAQVREEIALKLRNEQKAGLIMAQLAKTKGTTLEESAAQYGPTARLIEVKALRLEDDTLDSAGIAREAIGTAFALAPGAEATVADENGVLVVALLAKNTAAAQSQQGLAEKKQRLQQLTKIMQPYTVFQALEELANVKDRRYRFY